MVFLGNQMDIELSDKPGLGLEINYEEITKHPPLKKLMQEVEQSKEYKAII